MKIEVAGSIANARKAGEARANAASAKAIEAFVPLGLGGIYAERFQQARGAGGGMIADYAEVHGITASQALAAIKAEADAWEAASAEIEKVRQAALIEIRSAITLVAIDAIIDRMNDNG